MLLRVCPIVYDSMMWILKSTKLQQLCFVEDELRSIHLQTLALSNEI